MQMYNGLKHLVNVRKNARLLVKVSAVYAKCGFAVLTWDGNKLIDESFPGENPTKYAKSFVELNEKGEMRRTLKVQTVKK